MVKKARLLVTLKCERNCHYCCNKQKSIMDSATKIDQLDEIDWTKFSEIMISGGEPMLDWRRTYKIVRTLRDKVGGGIKLYLYTAKYQKHSGYEFYYLLDGIHYTVHENASIAEIIEFEEFQQRSRIYWRRISFRAHVVSTNNRRSITIIEPRMWKRFEIKPWQEDCPLPEGEELIILNEKWR